MSKIELAEREVKGQMINEILKLSNNSLNKRELEAKMFCELKYIYYNYRDSNMKFSNN